MVRAVVPISRWPSLLKRYTLRSPARDHHLDVEVEVLGRACHVLGNSVQRDADLVVVVRRLDLELEADADVVGRVPLVVCVRRAA